MLKLETQEKNKMISGFKKIHGRGGKFGAQQLVFVPNQVGVACKEIFVQIRSKKHFFRAKCERQTCSKVSLMARALDTVHVVQREVDILEARQAFL